MSQGKDLTKARFLFRAYSLINSQGSLHINRAAFEMYDSKNDEKLTVDEVYHMFEALVIGSDVYKECQK